MEKVTLTAMEFVRVKAFTLTPRVYLKGREPVSRHILTLVSKAKKVSDSHYYSTLAARFLDAFPSVKRGSPTAWPGPSTDHSLRASFLGDESENVASGSCTASHTDERTLHRDRSYVPDGAGKGDLGEGSNLDMGNDHWGFFCDTGAPFLEMPGTFQSARHLGTKDIRCTIYYIVWPASSIRRPCCNTR
jgi:hypothetical protein